MSLDGYGNGTGGEEGSGEIWGRVEKLGKDWEKGEGEAEKV